MRPLKRPKERMTADFLPARAIRKCFELLVILSCDARSRTSSFDYLVSVRKRLFSAVAASIFELACDSGPSLALRPWGSTEAVKLFNPEKFCGVPVYASAQALDFLATTKNPSFSARKPASCSSGVSG